MDNELVFLTIITIIVLGFCIANIVSYLINKNHIKETEGTVISEKCLTLQQKNAEFKMGNRNI